jgi:hypothetical protein
MFEPSLFFDLLFFKLSSYLLNSLFLQHFLHFRSHRRHLSILLHLVLINLRFFRKLGKDAKRIVFLGGQVHQGALLYFQILTSYLILSEDEIIFKNIICIGWGLLKRVI